MASKEHGVESIASECLSSRFLNYKNGYSAKSVPKSDQAGIQLFFNGLAVEVLPYYHKLYHTVAVFRIPVARKPRLILHHFIKFLFRGGRKPQTGTRELLLSPGLFKQIGHVAVVLEINHSFRPYYLRRPILCHEMVELVEV